MKLGYLIISLLLLLQPIKNQAQQKRAMLIAIGDYPSQSGWKRLSSLNDIGYLQQVLQLKGFAPGNITTLLNEAATLDGITRAMNAFVASCKTGDVVMLHFSGHGQQISDEDGDEADGYDEALVPFDAAARFDPVDYRGDRHLRDDQLGAWIDAISTAVGPSGSVLVHIDACHSGTATRTQEVSVARGNPTPFKIPDAAKKKYVPGAGGANDFLSQTNKDKGNVVVFSASSPTQVNYETIDANQQGVGALSYAFSRALATLPSGATYADLFFSIKAQIQANTPSQLPMMEGNGSQLLFAGSYKAANGEVYIDRWASDTSFTFRMGSLQQMAEGAELALIDPSSNTQVAKAIATRVSPVETMAVAFHALDKTKPWKVKVLSLPVSPYRLQVNYDRSRIPKSWLASLDAGLKSFGFVDKNEHADCWISYLPDSGLAILTKDNSILYLDVSAKQGKLSNEAVQKLKDPLQQMAKANFLRTLPDGGELASKVVFEVSTADGKSGLKEDLALGRGSSFNIQIRNKTKTPIYFALINLLPDGTIEVLLPDAASAAEDFNIQPGEAYPILDNMIPTDALKGREFLRLMVSTTPFDIRPIFNQQARRRGTANSWEQAMQGIIQSGENAPRKRSVSVNEITLLTQSFEVK